VDHANAVSPLRLPAVILKLRTTGDRNARGDSLR
jgi:hypothetical protein